MIGRAWDPEVGDFVNDKVAHVVLRRTNDPPYYEVYTSYTLPTPKPR